MLQRRTLAFLGLILALGGQYLLDAQTQMGILVLGGCLLITLLERWIYLVPLSQNWLGPLLLGILGLSYWDEPRGWFFFAWALIIAGTGLRADRFIQAYLRKLKAEEARREQLAAMGFGTQPDPDSAADEVDEQPAPEEPLPIPTFPPLTAGRVAMALLLASLAALVGALLTYLVCLLSGLQVDVVALLTGWLVGRAILQGTGGRSHRALQGLGALLSVLSVLAGRYLVLGALAPDVWLILFAILGAVNGYQKSRGYQGE
ncbi:MAG TPA: hypothetical protein VK191_09740 [Symbiobacteriaceae bacterium]|nr:hypothetical protein [Symbiobacteriaceae bacterium]